MSYTANKDGEYIYDGRKVEFSTSDYKVGGDGAPVGAKYRKIHLYQGYKGSDGSVGDTLWVKVLDKDIVLFDGGCKDGAVVVMLQNDPVVADNLHGRKLRCGSLLPVSSGMPEMYGDDKPVCNLGLMPEGQEVYCAPPGSKHYRFDFDTLFMSELTRICCNVTRRKLPKSSTANDNRKDV